MTSEGNKHFYMFIGHSVVLQSPYCNMWSISSWCNYFQNNSIPLLTVLIAFEVCLHSCQGNKCLLDTSKCLHCLLLLRYRREQQVIGESQCSAVEVHGFKIVVFSKYLFYLCIYQGECKLRSINVHVNNFQNSTVLKVLYCMSRVKITSKYV